MITWRFLRATFLSALVLALGAGAARSETGQTAIARLELGKAFGARSPWRFVARQGPAEADPAGMETQVPGVLRLCLDRSPSGGCETPLEAMPPRAPDELESMWAARYLRAATIVYPRGRSAAPLLLVQTASTHAGNGSQAVFTQLLAYRRAADRFARIYDQVTGTNNNEEVRFVTSGLLRGAVISAEPTGDAPYGYWIAVNELRPDDTYRQVMRYRSATRYGDGNPLAVIDSEMPNIQRRLGLWRPGAPLPLPAGACPKPRLAHMELWCR